MNTAFNFPMTLALLPLSTFGGGVVVLPRDDILLSGLAIGPNGEPISNDVSQAFHGALILGNTKLTVTPFGLVGHQSLGFTWNNQDRFSLDQDPSNITRLLLNEQVPLLANPGPVLTQILGSRFPVGSDPTSQPHGQQLDDQLYLRSVFLAARGRPEARGWSLFRVRNFRREPGPDPICLYRRHRRQGSGAGPPR